MFTEVKELPETVEHFERFPKIPINTETTLTPDFTVLFKDGSAIVGEISKVALHEGSLEKLCKQLFRYDKLTEVPSGNGGFKSIKSVDVLQLVHMKIGSHVVRRLIKERLENEAHFYKPTRRPVIVQFARESQTYHLQRINGGRNGRLLKGRRKPNIGDYLDNVLNVQASMFIPIKSRRALINDQADRLYLATHLYSKTWPSMYGGSGSDMTVNPSDTASVLREHHGGGRAADVRAALELLSDAGIASQLKSGLWRVSRKQLGRSGDRDIHEIIARRACDRRTRSSVAVEPGQSPSQAELQSVLFSREFLTSPELPDTPAARLLLELADKVEPRQLTGSVESEE